MQNPFLIGEHIYLRPLEKADAATLLPWFNDMEVTRFMRRSLPINLAGEEAFIEGLYKSESDIAFGLVVKADDRLIGAAGLNQINARHRHCQFGIGIGDKTQWGKGYGTEATRLLVHYAFEVANLHRVWLHVYAFNERGIRAYEKVGFKREGVLRQDYYVDGRYWDTVVMGILREEWKPNQQL